jgi:hypothetical protein
VPDGNLHRPSQFFEHAEAAGLSDIFQIDGAEGWLEKLNRAHEFLLVLSCKTKRDLHPHHPDT